MAILELKGVKVAHGATPVLGGIDLKVEEGEFIAIVGFSGSGKTTLMNTIAGLARPDEGSVTFRGKPVEGPGPERGVVFQSYSLMPWLTVTGNVALAVDSVFAGETRAARRDRTRRAIAMVGLAHAADRRPSALSGGMRQRVSLARTLAMRPEVLLLDEPLSALDALTRANLQDELLRIWEHDRRTVVMITNDVDEAVLLADRIVPLTIGPAATLAGSIPVNIPRPRDRAALNHVPEFRELKSRTTRLLLSFRKDAAAAAPPPPAPPALRPADFSTGRRIVPSRSAA